MAVHFTFGNWKLDADEGVLSYPVNDNHDYDINLHSIINSATLLDWIMQIAAKPWGVGECVADLVEAFRVLYHPQATICGQGRDKVIDPRQIDFLGSLRHDDFSDCIVRL